MNTQNESKPCAWKEHRPKHLKGCVEVCLECGSKLLFFDIVDRRAEIWFCDNDKCSKHRVFVKVETKR